MSVRILPFEPKYAAAFQALNLRWLEAYFYVEDKDRELLEECEANIIDKGGFIFLAEYEGHIAGCFALIRLADGVYELGKMAVDPNYQGLKIGQQLMQYAINLGRSENWEKIILYSHTKLESAIYIYRKSGFREIEMEPHTPYARSNIKMELELNDF